MCSERKGLFKTTIVFICLLQFGKAAFLRCYNGSRDNYLVTPLDQPLFISPFINPDLPTVIYTFGYRGKSAGPATTAVLDAYIAKKKRNVILLDWEYEAQSGILGIALGYALHALPNAKKIGRKLGDALVQLSDVGLNTTDIHLVGHSLGAHIMGFAGRQARKKGFVVARITGLDPARALFEGSLAIEGGLDRTCARFVDIVHTDPGGYGTTSSDGTVDIWPNYMEDSSIQPGCPKGQFESFSTEDLCSHDRSWRYFVEALEAPTAFPAVGASNFAEWLNNGGQTIIYLGDLTRTRAQGNFYLRTNPNPPFGMGTPGMKPDANHRRQRRNPKCILTRLLKYFR